MENEIDKCNDLSGDEEKRSSKHSENNVPKNSDLPDDDHEIDVFNEDGPNDMPDGDVTTVEKLKEELELVKDEILRGKAEQQNIRRRSEKDLANAHKYGTERFVKELLPVLDSMEKALEIAENLESEDAGMVEGIRMTRKMLIDSVGKFGVTAVNPLGEPFDPKFHQAISMMESEDSEPNSVINVMQTGYLMYDRVLRPAMVIVSTKKNT